MGIQLEELIENHLPDLPTNPVFPGTLQLSPGGKLILLMRDAGVTGGYPRILFLTEEAQSKLSQKKAGDPIRFKFLH
jgi:allophanate hydrolase subunit 2